MFWWDRPQVDGWLAAKGIERAAPNLWRRPADGTVLDSRQVAFAVIETALESDDLPPSERLALGFGLLDVLDVYAVAMYLGFEFAGPDPQHESDVGMVWEFCRHVLEHPRESTAVPYWLWVDWFEDARHSEAAFVRLTQGVHDTHLVQPGLRRIDRVLRISGPVRWEVKGEVLRHAVRHRQLHPSLLWAVQGAVEDVFGQVDVSEARTLLQRLRLADEDAVLKETLLTALEPRRPKKRESRRQRRVRRR
ncbi:hypothetical protein ACFJGV_16215 [Cnuibacter sp. UC19_7]|uniref:hypothetical protein n=1 Tax=Cnuibacter sp. UC19_7 TaxID=3350166 RepID=UPI00366E7333